MHKNGKNKEKKNKIPKSSKNIVKTVIFVELNLLLVHYIVVNVCIIFTVHKVCIYALNICT